VWKIVPSRRWQPRVATAASVQGISNSAGVVMAAHRPAEQVAGGQIDDRGQVQPAVRRWPGRCWPAASAATTAQLDGVASGVLEAVSVHRVLSDDPTSRAPHEQCIPCSWMLVAARG
jgi:hypothetical protein